MMLQLAMEYDPKLPFDCGSPDKVPKAIQGKFNK
jgi:hypothetical protein